MALQITGVRKPDRNSAHEAISHYRWFDHSDNTAGIDARLDLINWLQANDVDAYVADGDGKAWCEIRTSASGTKFLQTVADGKWSDNLLALPEC